MRIENIPKIRLEVTKREAKDEQGERIKLPEEKNNKKRGPVCRLVFGSLRKGQRTSLVVTGQ